MTDVREAWRYSDLRQQGLTEGQVRWRVEGGELTAPFRGVLLDGPAASKADQLRALFTHYLPEGAAVGFHTAAELHGFGEFTPLARGLHIVVPVGYPRTRLRGLIVHTAVLPYDIVEVDGIPCVSAARCAVDLARAVRRLDALPVLDGALRLGGCAPADLAAELSRHSGLRGVCQARELVHYAEPGAQVRQESQLRLVLLDGRLPRPELQIEVRDDFGVVRFVLDLGWPKWRVGAEYDGVSHVDRARVRADRDRHNWLSARGWQLRYFTDQDLYQRPRSIVSTLAGALAGTR